ncbi:Glucose-induced degradation complex subunit [Actinomortierella ambigua]|nr:Glucose-induced degradation complex subunit [Actinomortierella ambigua]
MDLDSDAQNLPKIDASVPRQLVLDYLLHNCYGETARAFMKDDLDISKDNANASTSLYPSSSSQHSITNMLEGRHATNGHSSSAFNAATNGRNGSSGTSSSGSSTVSMGHRRDCMNDAALYMELEKPVPSETSSITSINTNSSSAIQLQQQQRTVTQRHEVDAEGDSPMGEPLADQEDGMAASTFTVDKLHAHHIDEQLKNLDIRKAIRSLISKGDIGRAMDMCNAAFPGVLSIDPTSPLTTPVSIQMNFKMQCQKFIEIVRQGPNKGAEALMFAQEVLAVFRKIDELGAQKYVQELNDIVPILAYKDPERSPMANFLHQSERDKLADLMNSAVLGN